MVCQLRWFALPVRQNLAVVAADDRALARDFIRRTRQDILRQLKTAFRELVVTEHFFHQDSSYYATLGAKRAAGDDSNDNDPKGKRQRTQKW